MFTADFIRPTHSIRVLWHISRTCPNPKATRTPGCPPSRQLDFTLYQLERFSVVTGLEMISVAVGWQVYEITPRPLDLGYVRLAKYLPNVFLFLIAGHTADRFSRKSILLLCNLAFAVCCALLIAITLHGPHDVRPIYVVLVLLGIVRSFNSPAGRSLLPLLVPVEVFPTPSRGTPPCFRRRPFSGRH